MQRNGLWFALGAYGLWGLLPIYWKALDTIPALEILFHRMVWSLVFLGALVFLRRSGPLLIAAVKDPRTVLTYLGASVLLAANWGVYIWAVNSGCIVETSLGYFINPLMSVALGVVFFKETLRRLQWLAILLAAIGVLVLTWVYGQPPWISLFLAVSFAIYGVLKKLARLGAIEGLALETVLMFPAALAFLLYWHATGRSSFGSLGATTDLLLIASGVATALPLLFFAAAARRLPLSIIGVMQYIAPTIQFLLGVLVYNEPFDSARLIGFVFIWLALAVFTFEGLSRRPRTRTA